MHATSARRRTGGLVLTIVTAVLIRGRVHVGLFLLLAGIYVLTGPGRIDTIDGQYRYDVARNIVEQGSPIVTDRGLPPTPIGRDGRNYFLGPAASLAGVPLIAVGRLIDSDRPPLHEFLFSFTSAFLASAAGVLLLLLYGMLGVSRRRAVGWTVVASFCTLMWPVATSVFDQAQQACALLFSVYAGLRAARDDAVHFAVASGFAASVLVSYQEVYVAMVPAMALVCMVGGEGVRDFLRSRRFKAYAAGFLFGLAALLLFNVYRFGALSAIAPNTGEMKLLGNPLVGMLGLLASPGKSMFLYSPPLILAVLGWRRMRAEHATFARAVLITIGVHFAIIASLIFWGGDWAWGPRYLVVTLPLACLALPFVRIRPAITGALISIGLVVQLLGLSVDHQRFFLERGLADHFWTTDQSIYFTESALFARPAELVSVFEDHGPIDARRFAPNPYRSPTYAAFGNNPGERSDAPRWMRHFALYYTPRPWPLWMARMKPGHAPVEYWPLFALFAFAMALAGAALLARELGRAKPAAPPDASAAAG